MTQEALKLALEYIEAVPDDRYNAEHIDRDALITAIKEALAQEKTLQALHSENERLGLYKNAYAQPEQEPVAWTPKIESHYKDGVLIEQTIQYNPQREKLPYPQRTWVGLTDDEMEDTFIQCGGKWNGDFWKIEDADFHPFLRTIEAKLKEKIGA